MIILKIKLGLTAVVNVKLERLTLINLILLFGINVSIILVLEKNIKIA